MKRGGVGHPKTAALAEELGVTRAHAVGLLECLFHFTAQYASDGGIGRFDDKRIAVGSGWHAKPQRLIEALVTTGWLCPHSVVRLVVHQWDCHADRAVLQRLSRDSKKPLQCNHKDGHVLCDQVETVNFTSGSLPVPEPEPVPEPDIKHHAPQKPALMFSSDAGFSEFWAVYWRKDGKVAAQKAYRKKVRKLEDQITILGAVLAQRDYYMAREVQYRPHGATWLNQDRWKDDPAQLVNTNNSAFHKLAGVQVVRDARVEAIRQRMIR